MYQYDILAPRLAESALPGQFVIVKHGEYGERVPLTITDYDREEGTVSIVSKHWVTPRKNSPNWKKATFWQTS